MVKEKKADKQNTAVALSYHMGADTAPRMVAKGKGFIARKIVEIAQQFKVPVYFNAEVTQLLYQVSLDKAIPVSLYELMADVLAWAYSLEANQRNRKKTEV